MDEPELLAEMDRMLERAVRVARGGDLPGALTLLAELHGRPRCGGSRARTTWTAGAG